MSTSKLEWFFPEGGSNVGFNHAGIQHFVGDVSLFREVVQNSLDAKRERQQQVVVELARTTIERDDMDAATLLDVLRRCQKSKWLGEGKEQFARAVEVLDNQGPVPALIITDIYTEGASDDAGPDDVSAWVGLTDSEGVPVGKGAMSGGSYGLGKHAPFAATPLRTVLYSTCYKDSSTSQLRRRFIGRTILVTHYDRNGNQRSHSGYLGNLREPLKDGDEQIPELLKMDIRGTRLAIPGWEWRNEHREVWTAAAFRVIAEHYFYAVLNGRLGVTIEQERTRGNTPTTLDNETLAPNGAVYRMLNTRNGHDADTDNVVRYINVASQEPIEKCYIPGIGDVKLHVDVGPKHGSKKLALVRHPGVKITDIRGNMGPASPSFPHSWQPFTAVVSVTPVDEDADWVVRRCENPAHDRIDPKRADTEARRREARRALEKLGKWVRESIGKVAGRSPDSHSTESWELHDYDLTVTSPDGTPPPGRRQQPTTGPANASTSPPRGGFYAHRPHTKRRNTRKYNPTRRQRRQRRRNCRAWTWT